jgi:hypothetical protein
MMLGSQCSPCCGDGCPADGRQRSDPKDEGTWVPSGSWPNVTWTFVPNPGDESGNTWFFYGSQSSSKKGAIASFEEQIDWGNLCNWYSALATTPSDLSSHPQLTRRATRLPPPGATVHIYSPVSTSVSGPITVKAAYVWGLMVAAELAVIYGEHSLTATHHAHGTTKGVVFSGRSQNRATVNGGARFCDSSVNFRLTSTVGVVNGGAVFAQEASNEGVVNDGAVFYDNSSNTANGAVVNGGAAFYGTSSNGGTGFYEAVVNGGAAFYESSRNEYVGTVNGGAAFFDNACSRRFTGSIYSSPCSRRFVAHPSDTPSCNGAALSGCSGASVSCGCN